MIEKRSGERGGKWGEKRLTGMAGNTVHSTVFQNVKDREDDNMANENVPSPDPIRSNDQILPFSAWLDKDWFTLDVNLLREALEITPIDQAHQFESPPLGNEIMDFMNELGSPKGLYFVLRMVVNNLYQPWRAILSMINQCLTGKTSVYDRPRYPAIHNFVTDKANLGIATKKDKKIKHHVIPYCRFTKLIVCYLGRKHNINQRSGCSFNMVEDDHCLGNLKFVPKGEEDKVFGMPFSKELITNNIRNAPYYNTYFEIVAKHDHKITAEEGGKKKYLAKHPSAEWLFVNQPQTSTTDQYIFQRWFPVTGEASIGPSAQPEDATSANIVRNTPSPIDEKTSAKTDKINNEGDTKILNIGEEQGDNVATKLDLEEKTVEIDEGQAGSDH
nr:hypothetical protein [Tanacetum cinerariifolium]